MKFLIFLFLVTINVKANVIVLNENNTASLNGPVDKFSVSEVSKELGVLSQRGKSSEPIFLVLNTPGGSVFAGLELMQFVNTLRRPVYVVANYAASMGFHILQNSPRRFITKFGTIMSHRASGGFRGDIPQQVSNRMNHIIDLINKMDEQVVSRTKGKHTKKSYAELIRDEYYAVGSSAVSEGFADAVVTLKCTDSLINKTVKKEIEFLGMSISLDFSACPILTMPVSGDSKQIKKINEYMTRLRGFEL